MSPDPVPVIRPRRLRSTPVMRRMVAETSLEARQLVLPVFVSDDAEDAGESRPISSLPGVVQHTVDSLLRESVAAAEAGLAGVMLFGVPRDADKDPTGSAGSRPDGVLNRALAAVRAEVGDDVLVMADTCLDEFTDHGHCGVLSTDPRGATVVDNDATLEGYAEMALAQAEAGAHVVAPSGMMDGQIAVIRDALDRHGRSDTAILAYSAKYASAFYGPFREAVGSSLQGDRRTYQQDPANVRESLREVRLDLEEGADMVMVKPAMGYLDVLRQTAEIADVPVAAYQVSGEYAMISAAAEKGWIDHDPAVMESLLSIRRAGADVVLSYWALHAARLLADGWGRR